MADPVRARHTAKRFVGALARNGTTTALVFGAHFPEAQQALFEEAERSGLRITSGLVVSDRNLRPDLEVSPETAYATSRELCDRWHGRGRLRYAVTPRFSVSCSEPMLEACRALLDEAPGALFTSHINESPGEIDFVRILFPEARDYLDTYERAGLLRERSVLAHNVHVTDDELNRLASARAAIAHCPSSNAFLASGIFSMARHVEHGVRFGMGTDVGAGTGLSMLKEGLVAYHVQMVRDQGHRLGPAHLLWLATAAGADALGLATTCGDLAVGKAADVVSAASRRRVDARGRARGGAVLGGGARRAVHAGAGGERGRGARRRRGRIRAGRGAAALTRRPRGVVAVATRARSSRGARPLRPHAGARTALRSTSCPSRAAIRPPNSSRSPCRPRRRRRTHRRRRRPRRRPRRSTIPTGSSEVPPSRSARAAPASTWTRPCDGLA